MTTERKLNGVPPADTVMDDDVAVPPGVGAKMDD
jgi:hypothetical protein